jgi:hypothetical protein
MNIEERPANLEALLPLVEREPAHAERRSHWLLVMANMTAGPKGKEGGT